MHVGRLLACTRPLTGMRVTLLHKLARKLDVMLGSDCGDALDEFIWEWMRMRIRAPIIVVVTTATRLRGVRTHPPGIN